ncbi:hypothetical protein AAC387_Pa04g2961 [Persea americana]
MIGLETIYSSSKTLFPGSKRSPGPRRGAIERAYARSSGPELCWRAPDRMSAGTGRHFVLESGIQNACALERPYASSSRQPLCCPGRQPESLRTRVAS